MATLAAGLDVVLVIVIARLDVVVVIVDIVVVIVQIHLHKCARCRWGGHCSSTVTQVCYVECRFPIKCRIAKNISKSLF